MAEKRTVAISSAWAARSQGKGRDRPKARQQSKSADTRALEKRLEEALGLKRLTCAGGEKTMLTLEIHDFDQLDTVVDRLTRR